MQTTNNILLIRPSHFFFNTETESSNAFQNKLNEAGDIVTQKAFSEFEACVKALKVKGVNVAVFDDTAFP